MIVIPTDTTALYAGQTPKQILENAKLLLTEERWCQYAVSLKLLPGERLNLGIHISRSNDPETTHWSLLGAVARMSNSLGIAPPPIITFLDDLAIAKGFEDVDNFNDNTDHSGLHVFLDEAILTLDS